MKLYRQPFPDIRFAGYSNPIRRFAGMFGSIRTYASHEVYSAAIASSVILIYLYDIC
jgi:hypothetical protein